VAVAPVLVYVLQARYPEVEADNFATDWAESNWKWAPADRDRAVASWRSAAIAVPEAVARKTWDPEELRKTIAPWWGPGGHPLAPDSGPACGGRG
jgi:phytoene dehydrogenase-like protein